MIIANKIKLNNLGKIKETIKFNNEYIKSGVNPYPRIFVKKNIEFFNPNNFALIDIINVPIIVKIIILENT